MRSFLSLPLIVPLDDMGTSIVHDRVPDVLCPGQNVELHVAMDENEPDGKPTVSSTVELLCGVRDAANGFGLLRSIAGTLCSIFEYCKVCPHSHMSNPKCLQSLQQTQVDIQAIELLAPRIKIISASLCVPIHLGDTNEKEREKKLKQ